jgi:hypothetical protein
MIKVSVFYADRSGSKFDMDYYCSSHIPMVREKLGAACKGVAVEQGVGGATPRGRALGLLRWDTSISIRSRHFRKRSAPTPTRLWETFRTTPTSSRRSSSVK